MKNFRSVVLVFSVGLISFTVSACGVKSSPQHPTGSDFPLAYPSPDWSLSVDREGVNTQSLPETGLGAPVGIYQYPNQPSYQPPKE